MAHYQQLQSYISELAERSLESARATADQTNEYVTRLSQFLMLGSMLIIALSIVVTLYIGRSISTPITEMIGILSSIAAGKPASAVPAQQRGDGIGAMARPVARGAGGAHVRLGSAGSCDFDVRLLRERKAVRLRRSSRERPAHPNHVARQTFRRSIVPEEAAAAAPGLLQSLVGGK